MKTKAGNERPLHTETAQTKAEDETSSPPTRAQVPACFVPLTLS